MADLITHGCTALLVKAADRRPHHVASFVAGTCVPDLLGRVPPMALTLVHAWWPPFPEWLIYAWNVVHLPLGMALTAYVLSFCFAEEGRPAIFRNLLGGGALHIGVDLVQTHMGVGYMLCFPFSTWDFELGWIGSEDTVRIVPFLVPITALVCRWRWRRAG